MTAQRRTTLIAALCLVVSLAASAQLLRHIDKIRPPAVAEDQLYFSSPKMIHRMSLGFDGLMACIYWTRTVQYFGHRHYNGESSYNELAPLLEITTALDPQLLPAYQFGASFLAPAPPHGAGQPDRAIQLMEYGIQHNPDDWQLYYNLGFVYYTELKDYKRASEAFERGSHARNTQPFMKVMAALMAEHGGDLQTARLLWSATFETAHEKSIRNNAVAHLRALQVDEDVARLQAGVTDFGEHTGRLPSSMSDLTTAERLPPNPTDPDGNPYLMTPRGLIVLEKPDDFPFVTRGLPPDYKPSGLPRFHQN
jgi:tetratricopeptide (TPR) repeat protein